MSNDRLSLEALLLSRSYLYELFHKTFGGVPAAELLESLADEQTIEVVDEYAHANEVAEELKVFLRTLSQKKGDDGFLEHLRDEYTRLFLGPNTLPVMPWESPYISREPVFFSESTLSVRNEYAASGLRPKKYLHTPDDHVSLMCGFMSILAYESLEEFRAHNTQSLRNQLLRQRGFIESHMNTWLPQFAEALDKSDRTKFYACFAHGLAAFCALDSIFTGEAIAWTQEEQETDDSFEHEHKEMFAEAEESLARIKSLELLGLEDNELCDL